MAVILEPELEIVRAAGIAEATHVIRGHPIRHDAPQIPQEALALVRAAHQPAGQHREPRDRVIAVTPLEPRPETIRPVLRSHLIAVGDHAFERRPVFRRYTPQQFTDKGLEVVPGQVAVHLVDLEALALGRGWAVAHTRRGHAQPQQDPLTRRHVPGQGAIGAHV